MRIAFSGAACTGKTTTLKAFLAKWPQYKTPEKSYRHLITANKHSKNTDKKTQLAILDFMVQQQSEFTLHDNIAYDRCPLDNIVYTMWAHEKGKKGFNEQFVNKCIGRVQQGMRTLDIIFFMTRDLMGPIEDDTKRETDPNYVMETDNIFKAIHNQLSTKGFSPFFPQNDSPALIQLTGNVEERLEQISMYVTPEGNMYGEEQSLINMDEVSKMEQLIRDQRQMASKEKGVL